MEEGKDDLDDVADMNESLLEFDVEPDDVDDVGNAEAEELQKMTYIVSK